MHNILAFAMDNNGGISFNNRVCSHDRKLNERLDEIAALGDVVYATSPLKGGNIEVDWKKEDFQNVYFCGYEDPAKVLEWFNEVRIYKWNREYPSTVKFSGNMDNFELVDVYEFTGYSHECITEYVYIRK